MYPMAEPMWFRLNFALSILLLVGCGPSYVSSDNERTANRLLEIVPQGSSVDDLELEAQRRGWDLKRRRIHILDAGEPHYLGDCEGDGGSAVPVIVADFWGPLRTTVETLWIFNPEEELVGVCVRRTVDGP